MKSVNISFGITDKFAASTNFKEIIDSINNNYAIDGFQLKIDYKITDPENFQREESNDSTN
jgi:hypothetical protein